MRENTEQKNSEYGHFLGSEIFDEVVNAPLDISSKIQAFNTQTKKTWNTYPAPANRQVMILT